MKKGKDVLDHVLNRRAAALLGYQFLRLCPVRRGVNSSAGAGFENEGVKHLEQHKGEIGRLIHVPKIMYADPSDLTKMSNQKPGGVRRGGLGGVSQFMKALNRPENSFRVRLCQHRRGGTDGLPGATDRSRTGPDATRPYTAVLLSIVASVKRHGIDSGAYLTRVLTVLPARPARAELTDLLTGGGASAADAG